MDLTVETQIELTLRLVAALLLGAVIGWERELQRMPAGFRTHALVSLGSAIFTIVSAYAFAGPLSDPPDQSSTCASAASTSSRVTPSR